MSCRTDRSVQILDGKRREIKKSFVTSDTKGEAPQVSNSDAHKRKRDVTDVNEAPAAKRHKSEHAASGEHEDMETEPHEKQENSRKDRPTGDRPDFQKRNNPREQPSGGRPNTQQSQRPGRGDSAQATDRNFSKVNADQPHNNKHFDNRNKKMNNNNNNNNNSNNNNISNNNNNDAPNNRQQLPKQKPIAKKGEHVEQSEKPVQNKKSKEHVTPVKEVSVKVTDETALVDDPRPDHVTGPSSGIVNIKLAPQKKQFSVKELLSNTEQQVAGW